MSEKKYYSGLYGTNSIEFERGLINVYPFGIIGKQFNGAVKPHAHHNLLQLFIIKSGTTVLHVNQEELVVNGPSLIIIPRNMAHGFSHRNDVNGWIISLSDVVLEHLIQADVDILSAIDIWHVTPITEDKPITLKIYTEAQRCVDEYHSNLPGRILMMQTLVGQIIVNLYRLHTSEQEINMPESDSGSALYFRRFKQSIKASYSYKKTIDQYAKELSITSGYLNSICKKISNQSPKDILIHYFIIEAKFLLLDAEKSISQVSYLLQFEDPAYFTRIFKRKTGITPREFRKTVGTKKSLITP